jgi:ferritin-like metal-binding protein YciE
VNYRQMMIRDLQDLLQDEAEQASRLPQLAAWANDAALRSALREHAAETEGHAERLRQILEMARETPSGEGEVTYGVKGLVAEAQVKLDQIEEPLLRDLAIIATAQKMEHYEIASYGTARATVRTAGMDEAAHLLQITLDEEEAADRRLTEIALAIHKNAALSMPAMAV